MSGISTTLTTSAGLPNAWIWMAFMRLPPQDHSSEGTILDQMAESFRGLVELVRAFDDGLHPSRRQQRQNGRPRGRLDCVRLREQGEAAHAGLFPDQVGDIDRRLAPRRSPEPERSCPARSPLA